MPTAAEWIKELETEDNYNYQVKADGGETFGMETVEIVDVQTGVRGYQKNTVVFTVKNKSGKIWKTIDLMVYYDYQCRDKFGTWLESEFINPVTYATQHLGFSL